MLSGRRQSRGEGKGRRDVNGFISADIDNLPRDYLTVFLFFMISASSHAVSAGNSDDRRIHITTLFGMIRFLRKP